MPPPMHKVARPLWTLRRCISCNRVTRTRAPEAPIGWPRAMAPPFTLTFSTFHPRSLLTAQAWAAKASLASIRSRLSADQPAFFSAIRLAGIGPLPMIAGSTPAVAQESMRSSGGKLVLLLSGDLPALGHILGSIAHVIAIEGVPQPVADHRIDELGIAHLDPVAQVDAVRRLAHAFLPAGDDDLGIAVADRLVAERHGAQPRTAELIDAVGGDLEGDSGSDGGLPCRVLPFTGGEDLAHDHLRHVLRLDMGAAQRLGDRYLTKLMGRQAREPADEGPNRGPRGARNDDIGH